MSVSICECLAVVADRHGMWVKDVVRFDDLLQEAGVSQDDVTDDVIEAAERVNRNRVRAIQDRITKWNESRMPSAEVVEPTTISEPVKTIDKPARIESKSEKTTRKQVKLFGYSITAVIRWMGKQGDWTVDDAATAVLTLTETTLSDHTIRIQLKAGRDGQRGEPAAITPSQAKQLRKASK